MKVLVIDDSSLMRKVIMRALHQTELDIESAVEAASAQEGLEQLLVNEPDVILCDWNMPVMDGMAFLKEAVRKSQAPILMLTTKGGTEKVAEAKLAGAKGYLVKPFTPKELSEAISRFAA